MALAAGLPEEAVKLAATLIALFSVPPRPHAGGGLSDRAHRGPGLRGAGEPAIRPRAARCRGTGGLRPRHRRQLRAQHDGDVPGHLPCGAGAQQMAPLGFPDLRLCGRGARPFAVRLGAGAAAAGIFPRPEYPAGDDHGGAADRRPLRHRRRHRGGPAVRAPAQDLRRGNTMRHSRPPSSTMLRRRTSRAISPCAVAGARSATSWSSSASSGSWARSSRW